jgi:glyoxylase-like metal-dependent hydrolase (beta-lactamase superfamily II)
MRIEAFFDSTTNTMTYVVFDEATRDAIIIDPVLDFDIGSGKTTDKALAPVLALVEAQRLNVRLLLETHAHADHLSASQPLKARFKSAPLAIGGNIGKVQRVFRDLLELGADFPVDGRQFDRLLHPDERVTVGSLSFVVIPTPGHTPACMSYLFQGQGGAADTLFVGDALFMPDYGTGRCDFPGGSAAELYRSIHDKLYKLPEATRVFTCHDYKPGGRELRYESTIGEERRANIQLKDATTEAEFVAFRTARDKTLDAPRLLYPSIQVNIDAGHLPKSRFLKLPVR